MSLNFVDLVTNEMFRVFPADYSSSEEQRHQHFDRGNV